MPAAAAAATPSTLAMPLSTVTITAGLARRGDGDDFGRKPVAELEPVGHEELDVGAHRAQAAHADRARRRAVGVVIGDDQMRSPLAIARARRSAAASMFANVAKSGNAASE